MTDRSTSRGRDALTSSGRGGAGNIRVSSSQDRPLSGPDDFSDTRGREPAVAPLAQTQIGSTGRGGAGNFRSPSRGHSIDVDARTAEERARIKAAEARMQEGVFSTGRGGAGNMSTSRSRSRGPDAALSPVHEGAAQVHSSGRGGAGNIAPGPPPAYERGRPGVDGIHSTGRGGLANLTASPPPPPDAPVPHHAGAGGWESTGRGGAGNMSRERQSADGSRERQKENERAGSKERGGLLGRLHLGHHAHPHGQPETIDEGGVRNVGIGGGVGGGGAAVI
ncbi:hypothetical protein B0H15DRAFT_1018187 [Mycena belliarum]|uniref:Uncharacterized protein n=1 Tax=Mycena belliarum TaxID=1033014 RepID=A0AAD6UFN9_9AGAR|nr:hypothetical protein B0H15DRAFT_1018187 [Mycena belliae]